MVVATVAVSEAVSEAAKGVVSEAVSGVGTTGVGAEAAKGVGTTGVGAMAAKAGGKEEPVLQAVSVGVILSHRFRSRRVVNMILA